MNEPEFNESKSRMIERHLRGAKRFEQRKENLAEKKKRGGRPPRRRSHSHNDEDWDASWDDDQRRPRERGALQRPRESSRAGAGRSDGAQASCRVSRVARTEVHVQDGQDGQRDERVVQLAPALLAAGGVVVGDLVQLDAKGRVAVRRERYSWLERRAPGQGHRSKLIAANVDLGLIVLAPREDGLSLGFLDRALAAVRGGGIEPVVVVTKMDLQHASERREEIRAELQPWQAAGYGVHLVASPTGEGIAGLRELVTGQVTVLLGHSGVGKSTLVNALDPSAGQLTGEVREEDGRGRHTTTSSRLIPFADGGGLVDTPGIRQLVPEVHDPAELAASIPELLPLLGRCRFADCAHGAEPGCAVKAAAESDPSVAAAVQRWHRLLEPDG